MPPADFELSILLNDGEHLASARLTHPDLRAHPFVSNVPVRFDTTDLIESLMDPREYGRKLTAMLFADQRLLSAWSQARGFASGAGLALRLRLRLDVSTPLHSLAWETLQDPISQAPLAQD